MKKWNIQISTLQTRYLILIGNYAIKIPRLKKFNAGLLSNMTEAGRYSNRHPELCRVSHCSVMGLWLLMPRVKPFTICQWGTTDCKRWLEQKGVLFPVDMVRENFGWVDGHPVVINYDAH